MGTGADQVQQQLATGTAAYANIKTEHGKVGTMISRIIARIASIHSTDPVC
jgi:hypothetical protein